MTRSNHAKLFRTLYCGFAFAISLGCVQVAEAVPLNKASTGIPYRNNGKTATFGEGSQVARPNGTVPSGSGQIGQSGWYYGTGAQVNPASGQTMTMGANGEVFLAGTKYPFQAGYEVPAKDVALAALGLVGGWPGVALTATLAGYPYIKQWLSNGGVEPNPATTGPSDAFTWAPQEVDGYKVSCNPSWTGNDFLFTASCTAAQACAKLGVGIVPGFYNGESACLSPTNPTYHPPLRMNGPKIADDTPKLPKSMDDIAPYLMRTPFDPSMVGDVISGGGTINLPDPHITGPTSIQGQPTTSTTTGTQTINGQQVPTRTETTTQTTYNFTTNNNQVTNTTNNTVTTTVTTNQSTGVVIGNTTTETETKPEEKDDRSECEKNPKQLNCADLDTPDGEIPKSKFNVTYSIEDSWGGGSCPADVYANVGGRSIKAYDWQMTCGYVSTYVRPILLLLCAFGALLIVMPGRAES